jgi:hypothetical protein
MISKTSSLSSDEALRCGTHPIAGKCIFSMLLFENCSLKNPFSGLPDYLAPPPSGPPALFISMITHRGTMYIQYFAKKDLLSSVLPLIFLLFS